MRLQVLLHAFEPNHLQPSKYAKLLMESNTSTSNQLKRLSWEAKVYCIQGKFLDHRNLFFPFSRSMNFKFSTYQLT